MKKGLLNITADKTRKVLRQAVSPAFLVSLLCSALLWYTTRLSNEYDTDIPLNIRIDGQKYRLTATVSGRGSTILAQRLSLKRRLRLSTTQWHDFRSTRIESKSEVSNTLNKSVMATGTSQHGATRIHPDTSLLMRPAQKSRSLLESAKLSHLLSLNLPCIPTRKKKRYF